MIDFVSRAASFAILYAAVPAIARGATSPADAFPWIVGDWSCRVTADTSTSIVREHIFSNRDLDEIQIVSKATDDTFLGIIKFSKSLNAYVEAEHDTATGITQMESSRGSAVVPGRLTLYGRYENANGKGYVRQSYTASAAGGYDAKIEMSGTGDRWTLAQSDRCRRP